MRCKVLKSAMGLPMCTGDHTGPDASVGLYYGMTVVGQRARCRSAKCESLASCGRPSSRLRPNPQIETLAMQPPQDREDRLVAAAVDGLWFGVWIGVAVLTILLALFDWRAIALVLGLPILALPVWFMQFAAMVLAPRWLVRRGWRLPLLIVVSHLFSVATWTLLWSATEYGAAWRDVLGDLLLVHAMPAALQVHHVVRRMRRARRVPFPRQS
jgi:hypothetical protein